MLWAHYFDMRKLITVQGRADGRTVEFPIWEPILCYPLRESWRKTVLSEVWALQLADRISSIVALKIVYFLASKNTEEPGTTAFGKWLLSLPRAFMDWAQHHPAVLSETWGLCDAAMLAALGKPLSLWDLKESTRVCQSVAQSTVFLCRKHLGMLETCPSTPLYLSAHSEGLVGPSENRCLETVHTSKQPLSQRLSPDSRFQTQELRIVCGLPSSRKWLSLIPHQK